MNRLERLGLDPDNVPDLQERLVRQGVGSVDRWAASRLLRANVGTWYRLGQYKSRDSASESAYYINHRGGFGFIGVGWVQAVSSRGVVYIRAI